MIDIGAFAEAGARRVSKASATDFFGGAPTESIFSAGIGAGASDSDIAAREIIASNEREINRIRGYKVQLTPTDNQRLKVLRTKIIELNEKANSATATELDFDKRKEFLAEADRILGKPSADVETDDILATLRKKIDDLLAPNLNPAVEKRVAVLEKLKSSFETQIARNIKSKTPQLQLQNVQRQIINLTPPRNVNELSKGEQREYNQLAELVNKHVGDKLVLGTREAIRVAELQTSINELKSSLPADTSGGPSAAAVARAYVRLA